MRPGSAVGRLAQALVIALGLTGTQAAHASTSRDVSFRPDPFAAAPKLSQPSIAEQLKALEERANRASACVALCELAASIDAHPLGREVSIHAPIRTEGFTGHYWDNEAGLYYAKARFYDPQLARFTQADSFLGNNDDPPSLHRYGYAADNPTMYSDPTGHIADKFVDQQIRDTAYTGRYADTFVGRTYNGWEAFKRQAAYEASNLVTFGALRRQDNLVDQNLAWKITDSQFAYRSGANFALSSTQAVLTLLTGGTASTALGAFGRGAGVGVLGQGISDVGEVYGTKTKLLSDVRASDYLVAGTIGGLAGLAGFKAQAQAARGAATTIEESPRAGLRRDYENYGSEFDSDLRIKEQPLSVGEERAPFKRWQDSAPDGFQDHHIVSDKNPLTKSHELLDLADFDLQSRPNKIFLPKSEAAHPTRSIHYGKHRRAVSAQLADAMDQIVETGKAEGWTTEQYREALRQLLAEERAALRNGLRALNKNARQGAQ